MNYFTDPNGPYAAQDSADPAQLQNHLVGLVNELSHLMLEYVNPQSTDQLRRGSLKHRRTALLKEIDKLMDNRWTQQPQPFQRPPWVPAELWDQDQLKHHAPPGYMGQSRWHHPGGPNISSPQKEDIAPVYGGYKKTNVSSVTPSRRQQLISEAAMPRQKISLVRKPKTLADKPISDIQDIEAVPVSTAPRPDDVIG